MNYIADHSAVTRLVCMDLAGTTVDDGDAIIRAFRQAMSDSGVEEYSQEFWRAERIVLETMGQSKISVFRLIFEGVECVAQFANKRFEAAYSSIIEGGGVRPMPWSEELFAALRDAGIRVCLTTGFSSGTRQSIIDALGWGDIVDLALSPNDVGRGPPAPNMILTAIMRLGIDDVREVAVAGDTISDLLSGRRAGAGIVAGVLTGAHDRQTLMTAPHTHILDTVWDLLPLVAAGHDRGDLAAVAAPTH